jgi:hypothetical protein
MASVQKRGAYSWRLTVYSGKDASGKTYVMGKRFVAALKRKLRLNLPNSKLRLKLELIYHRKN